MNAPPLTSDAVAIDRSILLASLHQLIETLEDDDLLSLYLLIIEGEECPSGHAAPRTSTSLLNLR